MREVVMVGVGGFLGAVLRYWLSGLVQSWTKSVEFPYGTLAVNLLGSLILGVFAYLVESRGAVTPEARLFFMIGMLGAFTTFSTFANESYLLGAAGAWGPAFLNLLLNTALGLAMIWLGRWAAYGVWR